MKELLIFLIQKITGATPLEDFDIDQTTDGDRVTLTVSAKPSIIGLIIGREGKTIKNIRKIVSIKAVLERKAVNIAVVEQ